MEQNQNSDSQHGTKITDSLSEQVPIVSLDHQKVPAPFDVTLAHKKESSKESVATDATTKLDDATRQDLNHPGRRKRQKYHNNKRSKYNLAHGENKNAPVTIVVDRHLMPNGEPDKSKPKQNGGHGRGGLSSSKRHSAQSDQSAAIADSASSSPQSANQISQLPVSKQETSSVAPNASPTPSAATDGHRESRGRRGSRSPRKPKSPLTRPEPIQPVAPRRTDVETQALSLDKYAVKYSYNHLQLILSRARHAGRLTMFAFWLCFLIFSTVIDYIKYDKNAVIKPEAFDVVKAFDIGIISNMDAGKWAWIVALFLIIWIFLFFMETLNSRYPYVTITVSISIVIIFSHIVVMAILGQIWNSEGLKPYFILVITYTIVWLFWVLHECYQVGVTVFRMDDATSFPPSTISRINRY